MKKHANSIKLIPFKLDSKTNDWIAEKSRELSVSFELSGDESTSIELSPTKDSEKET